jgi:hypothetical protein
LAIRFMICFCKGYFMLVISMWRPSNYRSSAEESRVWQDEYHHQIPTEESRVWQDEYHHQIPKVEMAGSCFENEKQQTRETGKDMDTWGQKLDRSTQRNLKTHNRERKERAGINSWTEATNIAKDRDKLRGLVNDPILQRTSRLRCVAVVF